MMVLVFWKKFYLLTGVIVTFLGYVSSTDCPDTWVAFEGSCYLFGTDTPLKYFEAEHYCRQHEGHLVHVNDAMENAFLKNFLTSLKPAYYWMGLTDERIEGVWVWYDTDTVANFTDWAQGQPDNWNGKEHEDCCQYHPYHDFHWNDAGCDNAVEPLCEIRREESQAIVG